MTAGPLASGMPAPSSEARPALRWVIVLTENWTMTPGSDPMQLVRWAQEAEDAGFDAAMTSEHIVLGPASGAAGRMPNPREYALPGNQDPDTPWPSTLLMLAAVAARTSTIRLAASAVIAPLRHPLQLAKELATLDALSGGRLTVQPTVSWHRDEYAALGVPFTERGARLDEHLQVWRLAWQAAATGSPFSFEGRFYRFDDVWVSPGPAQPDGPRLWFGGADMHDALLHRLVHHGHGWNPLGAPSGDDRARLSAGLQAVGRDLGDLELVGGTRATFTGGDSCADLGRALEDLPAKVAQGFTTFCIKPSQFIDDPADVGRFCREVVARGEALLAR